MIISKDHKCNACMLGIVLKFEKPSVIKPTVIKYKCSHCESVFILAIKRVSRAKASGPELDIENRVVHYELSSKFIQMMRDKRKAGSEASKNPYDRMP